MFVCERECIFEAKVSRIQCNYGNENATPFKRFKSISIAVRVNMYEFSFD